MKSLWSALLAVAIIGGGIWGLVGERMQTSTSSEFSTPFVRLDEHH